MKNRLLSIIYQIDRHLHIRRQLETGSVWKNVLVAYVLLVIVPTGIMLSWYYHKSVSTIEKEMAGTVYKAVEQAAQHIDLRLESVEEISDNIFMNSMFNQAFDQTESRQISAQLAQQQELTANIDLFQRREDVQRIKLYFKTPNFYTNEHVNFFEYRDIEQEPWIAELEDKNGAISWFGVRNQEYSDGAEEKVLTCARLMKSPGDISKATGALLIDVKYENIHRILEETRISDQEQIFLFNEDGQWMTGTEGYEQDREEQTAKLLDMTEGIEKASQYYYMTKELATSGWRIGVVMPEEVVMTKGAQSNKFLHVLFLVLVFILFMMVFFVMFGYLMLRVNWRIKRIVQKLEREGIEYNGEGKTEEKSEVYQLEGHIDHMIEKARSLIQEAYHARLEKQEAELHSLQAQINPHFLYNTLDNISWMAIRANAQEVCDMIQTLSQYFRLSLSGGKDIVTIEDELKLAQVYLEIQNSRFRGIITTELDIPKSMCGYAIPKLTLQPLLENAVIHGLQAKEDKEWKLRIRGEELDGALRLYVVDNGVGMTEEQAKSLMERARPGKDHGYGLYNVNKRIQLYCGEEYGLEIQSKPGAGTSVCVRLARMEYTHQIS